MKRKSLIRLIEEHVLHPEKCHSTDYVLRGYGIPGATDRNHTQLCLDGKTTYDELTALIDEAEIYIHMAIYVFKGDVIGKDIIKRLARRASDGVQVRLLLDSFGSLLLWRWLLRPITKAGGKVEIFMPLLHIPFRGRGNLRNHRKMAIIDGKKASKGIPYTMPSFPRYFRPISACGLPFPILSQIKHSFML